MAFHEKLALWGRLWKKIGTPPQLTGVQGQLSFSRWGYRGDFGFPRVLRHSPTTLFYKGYFVNGYREGRGQEYDENGNVVFDGYYKKGKKLNIVPSNEMGKGYWKELDEKGERR